MTPSSLPLSVCLLRQAEAELNFTKIYQVQNMQYKTTLWVLLTLSCSDPKPQQVDHLRYVVWKNLIKLGQD